MKICILNNENKIIDIKEAVYPIEENERFYFLWNEIGATYSSKPSFEYLKKQELNVAKKIFVQKKDAIRWIKIDDQTYGFDCDSEDITNFMAARTALEINASKLKTTPYKVWKTKTEKQLINLDLEQMNLVFNTVRESQLAAYVWYEILKEKIISAKNEEELRQIDWETI